MHHASHRSAARQSPTPSYSSSVTSSASTSSSAATATPTNNSMSSGAPRHSSGSARSPRHRNQVNLSTIEKSVTHLLVATKQLLETLTAWSRQQATEAEVSDVYVRLGSEFNIACRAFTQIGVETADLGNVPDALRTILENTLSQDASPQSLDVYLPRIREIIINLLHGLKRKQQKLRQRQSTRDNGEGSSGGGSERGSGSQSSRKRSTDTNGEEQPAPPRTSSLPGQNSPPVPSLPAVRDSTSSTTSSIRGARPNTSSIQSAPPPPPPPPPPPAPPSSTIPAFEFPAQSPVMDSRLSAAPSPAPTFIAPPPPPVPHQPDALAALAQHSSLERRASRRYSAYQIAKLTGNARIDVPVMPSSRTPSNVPGNRESMEAIRKRTSQATKPKSQSKREDAPSPVKNPNRISEEAPETPVDEIYSPTARTPEDKIGPFMPPTIQPKVQGKQAPLTVDTGPEITGSSPAPKMQEIHEEPVITNGVIDLDEQRISTQSSDIKELTLFLQLGRSVKKVVLTDGAEELTVTALRLLFISKFNYNPPSGDDFPEIYLQDSVSGVRYELEDLRDVKDRAVLCLNVEVLDEVKRHIDDGMEGLKTIVQGIAGSVQSQALQISLVAERQEETAAKIAALAANPPPAAAKATLTPMSKAESGAQLTEVRDLRKDLAVLRQTYTSFVNDMTASISTIKTKASTSKPVATSSTSPPGSEGRHYVEAGKTTLATDADTLVNRVDDLQDTVEDLRKDVVARGVRPLPRQLEIVSKEIAQARLELKKMIDYIKREKPAFRRVWERELEVVCEEQEFFNMQENLIADLEDDLDKAMQTFALVEQCSEQQLKTPATGLRVVSRGFAPPAHNADPEDVKDNVLSEVRALQPNHESRLEAIERAEKARLRDMESRVPPFQKELGQFVEEGKLKKTGGAEEVERVRLIREEQARKAIWEHKLEMDAEEEESSEEEETDEEDEDDEDEAEDKSAASPAIEPAAVTEEKKDTA